jgi:hypothetical protein
MSAHLFWRWKTHPTSPTAPADSVEIFANQNVGAHDIVQRKQFLVLSRVLLALPGPVFLMVKLTQYFQRDPGSIIQLHEYAEWTLFWFISTPLWGLSLLIAQIDADKPQPCIDALIWTRARAFEAALYTFSSWSYSFLLSPDKLGYAWGWCLANFVLVLILFTYTKLLRAIISYKGREYHSFVLSQATWLSACTMFCSLVTVYAVSAMSRLPIPLVLSSALAELSLSGIGCADQAEFMNAFESSSGGCPALPFCGYPTYEYLCQAVQYAPMNRALLNDCHKVVLFILVGWFLVSMLLFGTGRARADQGYSHMFSRHMLFAMLLGLAQLSNTFFSFARLLLIVPLLRLPRPGTYFDRTDLFTKELPLTCYGYVCDQLIYWGFLALYVIITFALNFDFLKKFASRLRISDEAQKQMVEEAIKELRRQGWDDDAPSFYFIPAEWVRECNTKSLPRMQTLRDVGHLTKIKIPLASAFHEPAFCGGGIMANILFVSHRWEDKSQPDVDGEQLKAIKAYLEAHTDIKWVWFDYSSMPQKVDGVDTRIPEEKAEFQLMLAAIADLYLTAHVLILLDGSYASRFWTLTEAWCSMQTVTSDGLRPAEAERRYTIKCIHNADDEHDAKGLVDKVSKKTPDEMYRILEKPDVNVTNAKDKETMLPKILEIDGHVVDTFQKLAILPEPKPAVATAAPNLVPALEKRYAIGSRVSLKRSNGEETLAYVNAYDTEEDAEEALYTVEIETLGSGQTEKCHEKDLRAAGVFETLISSARASLFASKADDSDLHHA